MLAILKMHDDQSSVKKEANIFSNNNEEGNNEKKEKDEENKGRRELISSHTAVGSYQNLCCSAYNCLIVTFISTQSNKAHFQTYLFESKGWLWRNIIEEDIKEFDF